MLTWENRDWKRRGVPFAWGETKSVDIFKQLFRDLPQVTHVFDLTPGSGCAALAAWHLGLNYEGLAFNHAHKDWLDNVMDTCMYAVVAEGVETKDSDADLEFQEKVRHFFGPQVDAGMRWLKSKDAQKAADDDDPAVEPDDEEPEDDEPDF